jgi:tripeptidyl-peptidase-1
MLSSLLTSVFVAAALASPIAPSSTAHERRDAPPRGWLKIEKVPTGSILPMRVGLVQSNLDKGHDMLMDV